MRVWFAEDSPSPQFKTLNVPFALMLTIALFSLSTAAMITALFARIIRRNKSVVFVAINRFAIKNAELVHVVDAVPICVLAASTRKDACARGKVDDN
jgi:hypothetical protein